MEKNKKSLLDILMDENDHQDVVLYDENGRAVKFKQVALISHNGATYVILKPRELVDGIDDDEAFAFLVNVDEEENVMLELVDDQEIAVAVFDEYYEMVDNKIKND